MIKTAEFVTPKHPDKRCDVIADSLLDAYLVKDPKSRVALEIMGGHNRITVSGEVTSKADIDIKKMVGEMVEMKDIVVNVTKQSEYIAQGVDNGGAGDQGIMIGYATNETKNFMPLEYELARALCYNLFARFPYDGKTQVTVKDGKVMSVVASFQNTKNDELLPVVKELIKSEEYLINPAGEWTMGGFDADSGLSGRKVVVDAYGPEVPVGGGSFSGKDSTKADRSGAYMARYIAVDYLKKFNAKKVLVKLAYAIGKKDPVMAEAIVDRTPMTIHPDEYDLSMGGIYKKLQLDKVKFAETAAWGHFGRDFNWG